MAAALALAGRGLGRVAPNPAVGCVIVNNGHVVGRGWTQPGGRPHAETEALRRAGAAARGGTAYVSLEPCAHHGKTPPCAEALVAAGLARVVIACPDPDPRVAGQGVETLRAAGVAVTEDVLRTAAETLNCGFLTKVIAGRPMVTLKMASSLDGRVATATGNSQWITGQPARRAGHMLRATHDAIAVGVGTVMADDPALTCRLGGMQDRSPIRVVFDSRLSTPRSCQLVATAHAMATWIMTTPAASKQRREELAGAGVDVLDAAIGPCDRIDLASALAALAEKGVTRLMVEGGPRLATAFLRAGLVDRVAWFAAPLVLGGDAMPALSDLGVDRVSQGLRLEPVDTIPFGDDMLRMFDVVSASPVES